MSARRAPPSAPEPDTHVRLPETSRDWPYLYAALVFAIAAFFLFSIRSTLTPLIAYVLFVLLLAPYAGSDRHTTLLFAATLALFLWLLESIGSLFAPFVLAFVIAYILDPAVDVLERRRLKRGLAVVLLLIPIAGLIILTLVLAIPALIDQVESLISRLPAAARAANTWLEQVRT